MKQPYTFVPVATSKTPHFKPVFHNGYSETGEQLFSGQLYCEIDALTPLIVGNYQYDLSEQEKQSLNIDRAAEKSALEPLFLNGDINSPVVISGSSLKGMLRHNIGAILNAPMERVQEQYYSYRPNLGWETNPTRYECREAVVTGFHRNAEKKVDGILIKLLRVRRQALFIDQNTYDHYKFSQIGFGNEINPDGYFKSNYRLKTPQKSIEALPRGDYKLFRYRAGLDGDGQVATTYKTNTPPKDDVAVLINSNTYEEAIDTSINENILIQFLKTKNQLIDPKFGHASRNKIDDYLDAIKRFNIEVNQLIYVEIDKQNGKVVSFGNNFRYRWKYADSVLTVQDGNSGKNIPRYQVNSPATEKITGDDEDRLTGARLLFGYSNGIKRKTKAGETALNIAEEDSEYDQLAGRISVNAALEQLTENSSLNDRFIVRSNANDQNNQNRFYIPLKVLGQPRASAVEFYLKQNDNFLNTYGDLPGVEESGAELNGRKFYRHQPVNNPSSFEGLNADNNLSTIAKFVSKPGSKFRFTVRFKDLRQWELGLLMVALNPEIKRQGAANKLGHARPLGLGSIRISIDSIQLLDENGQLVKQSEEQSLSVWLDALEQEESFAANNQMDAWLQILDYSAAQQADYQRGRDNEIYNYHTDIRSDYSKKRRKGQAMSENFGEPVTP